MDLYGFAYDDVKKRYYRIPPGQPQIAKRIKPQIVDVEPKMYQQSWLKLLRDRETNGTSWNCENKFLSSKLSKLTKEPSVCINTSLKPSISNFYAYETYILATCRIYNQDKIVIFEDIHKDPINCKISHLDLPVQRISHSFALPSDSDSFSKMVILSNTNSTIDNRIIFNEIHVNAKEKLIRLENEFILNLRKKTLFCVQQPDDCFKYRIGVDKGILLCFTNCNNNNIVISPDKSQIYAISKVPNNPFEFVCTTRLGTWALCDERSNGKSVILGNQRYPCTRSLTVSQDKLVFGGTMYGQILSTDIRQPCVINRLDYMEPKELYDVECKVFLDSTGKLLYVLAPNHPMRVCTIPHFNYYSIPLSLCCDYSAILCFEPSINGVIYKSSDGTVNIKQL